MLDEIDFLRFYNLHKDIPAVIIGHGPTSGTVTTTGHVHGPKGFEYKGGWEKFKGIKLSCHYKEYASDYTVNAEWQGLNREVQWMQEGEVKFVGGLITTAQWFQTGQFKPDPKYIYVPFIRNWWYDNTGNLAWWIAYWMGCNPIYLAGLDYTMTDRASEFYALEYCKFVFDRIYKYMTDRGRKIYATKEGGRLSIPIKNPLEA